MKTIQKFLVLVGILNLRFIVIMNFVLTNIEVFVVIVLLNIETKTRQKEPSVPYYLCEFKAPPTSLEKLECANLKLNENEYDANFNTSKVYNTWI